MANGDVQASISDQYLQTFDRSVGVSGMQKLQSFQELQKLGYAGQLGSMKQDFHGLKDFKNQMNTYSSTSRTLRIAWSLIQWIVPNNISIQSKLFTADGLGTVGQEFQSIHGFGQVFSLTPNDLKSPATVSAKASVYKNQSTQANVITDYAGQTSIGGGASPTVYTNASAINGILVVGVPGAINNTLIFDGTNLVWGPGTGGGGGGGGGTPGGVNNQIQVNIGGTFGGLPFGLAGQYLRSNGPGALATFNYIAESEVTNLVADLASKVPITRVINTTLPLTGGGALSSNLFLGINNFTGDTGFGGLPGAVPAPAAGDAALGKVLKADGTWGEADANSGIVAIASAVEGVPAGGQLVAIYAAYTSEVFPANFASPRSYGTAGVNPTANANYTVFKNGITVGQVQVQPSGAFVFSTVASSSFTLNAGDRLTIVAPGSPDATLSDVGITLVGTRTGTIAIGAVPIFTWRGTYNPATTYQPFDVVAFAVSGKVQSYVNKVVSTGNAPTNTTFWDLLAQAGADGSVLPGQIQQQVYVYGADTGAANAYAITQSPAPTLIPGSLVVIKAAHANTGASTIVVNGGSPIAITKSGSTPLVGGEISAGQVVDLIYDGTNFQLLSGASSVTIGGTNHQVQINSSGTLAGIATGTTGQYLRSNGSGADPAFFSIAESEVTNLVSDLAGKVPTSRSISTSLPLTGGGDLSANRTLAINDFVGDSGSGGLRGTVPAPAAGDAAASKVLKADGTWGTVSAGSSTLAADTDVSISSLANRNILIYHTSDSKWHNDTLIAADIPNIAESQVTSLVSDLALKAPLASPALTGIPTAPTAAGGTNTTQIATTAFVEGELSSGSFATKSGVQQEAYVYSADSGSTNAYAVTLSPAPTIITGSSIIFKASNSNTGASTLNVNGTGPVSIVKSVASPLDAGDILAGQIVAVTFDGTHYQMQSTAAGGFSSVVAIASAVPGLPSAGQIVGMYTAYTAEVFPANFSTPNSYGTLSANPTSTATYTIYKNGITVGSISVSTSGVFTFSTVGGTSFTLNAGDRLTIVAPGSQDATMQDVAITLVGTRTGAVAAGTAPIFTWFGPYNNATTYQPYSIVSYQGGAYISLLLTVGNVPTNATYWQLLMGFGWNNRGAYSGATAYVPNDVVTYLGSTYLCIAATTGNLPTNVSFWQVVAQSATVTTDQIQQESLVYATDTGTANAYAVTQSPTPTLIPGSFVIFKAANANTTASTLTVNGGSPIALVKKASQPLVSGDILANQIVKAIYDGTNFQIGEGSNGGSPLVIGFVMSSGVTGTNVGPMLVAPRAGTISKAKILIKASDAVLNLTFRIMRNGVNVFSANPTITAGTSSGTLSTFTSLTSSPLVIAADDKFSIDITSGSSSWQFTVQLES
jgi:hypothetical protein